MTICQCSLQRQSSGHVHGPPTAKGNAAPGGGSHVLEHPPCFAPESADRIDLPFPQ